jgi:hypothetical protein
MIFEHTEGIDYNQYTVGRNYIYSIRHQQTALAAKL